MLLAGEPASEAREYICLVKYGCADEAAGDPDSDSSDGSVEVVEADEKEACVESEPARSRSLGIHSQSSAECCGAPLAPDDVGLAIGMGVLV